MITAPVNDNDTREPIYEAAKAAWERAYAAGGTTVRDCIVAVVDAALAAHAARIGRVG